MLFDYLIVNDAHFYSDCDKADAIAIANATDDFEWGYMVGIDGITGLFCVMVFDEDGWFVGVL